MKVVIGAGILWLKKWAVEMEQDFGMIFGLVQIVFVKRFQDSIRYHYKRNNI
jgi:hypothetical protein